ncbi:mandelate racemase [Mumia zhuanghuii]|uniref:Mandelate racemase/muconate lactonizing enzyme family protein n=2 Tax=Mumia TaxID=1546255 RepID=A0ABW1QI41_9ACTN|nr:MULTISPECIES: enolase C-terminal domain-like protein [Mumia]KAA1418290.1 mandelate racemase [Mumia zhuanghuii]
MRATVAAVHTAPMTLDVNPDLVVRGARGVHDRSEFLLVRVVTSDGVEGFGEVSATPLWSGEDGTSADHFVRTRLAPAIIGRPLASVADLEDRMDRVLAGNPFTKAGVATALWDAYARTLDVPLAVALGGPRRETVDIKLSLSGDGDALEPMVAAARKLGFDAFKVKVGLEVAADVARVRTVRELVGPDVFVGADANGGWSRSDAFRAIPQIAAAGAAFIEQPVAPGDLDGLAATRRHGLPVVADESVFGMSDLTRLVRSEAADCVSLYIGKSGGPGRALAMGSVAAAFGLDVVIGSNGEFGLGAAAQLHVACALPRLSADIPSDIIGAFYYREDVLADPLDSDGRTVRLGAGAGLGVRPRPDLIEELR